MLMTKLRPLMLIFMLSAMFASMSAEISTIGYCNGDSNKNGAFSVEGNTYASAAIYLTPSVLQHYTGGEIIALRAALSSKVNLDLVSLWVRSELDGENLAMSEITSQTTPALSKGWIETPVEVSVPINEGEGLYIGMTYHQKAASKALSIVGTGFENSFFFQQSSESEWTDMSHEGILSIEAVVNCDNTVEYDLALLSGVADLASDPSNALVNVRVANNGKQCITGFTLSAQYEGLEHGDCIFNFDTALESGHKEEVLCCVPRFGDILEHPLTISLVSINDGDDAIPDNNSVTVALPAVKKAFVEEYTTEPCGNCPRVARYLHEVMEEEAYAGKVVAVCHHAGFGTDPFTQPCDDEMIRMFNIGGAPYVSYDRFPYFNDGRVTHCPEKSDLRTYIDRRLTEDPGVKIAISPSLESDQLFVTVTLERTTLNISNPCLTVYVTEDNVKPFYQRGNEDGSHIHRHVIRAYNSTWGDPVVWNGSRFSSEYTFALESDWKRADLNVVAVVGNYNNTDSKDNVVVNCEEIHLGSMSAVAGIVSDPETVATRCYDLSGRATDIETPGFKIIVITLDDGSTRTDRVFVRP